MAGKKLNAYQLHTQKERRAGKTMKQAAASWRAKKKTPRSVRKTANKARAITNRGKAILGRYGATGLAEDAAIGYFGSQVLMGMGYPLESALPLTRVIQGAAGKALNRRGKDRLAYGVIDLIDVYLIRQGFKIPQLGKISLAAWQ